MTSVRDVEIAAARPAELVAVQNLLRRAELPTEGLDPHVDTLLVARDGEWVVGSAALEVYGASALLRSVAVDSAWRGRGLGVALAEAALALARDRGVARIYLLTETAGGFFPRFGFRAIPRTEVGPEVQRSEEFTSLCPESCLAMVLELGTG